MVRVRLDLLLFDTKMTLADLEEKTADRSREPLLVTTLELTPAANAATWRPNPRPRP